MTVYELGDKEVSFIVHQSLKNSYSYSMIHNDYNSVPC